ncbi:MAG: HlyD family efflux transporter periplasmic adaptor subunit [Clostridia bacterium]|nr:HlyD family efflux transporter periplasmic adaptor subunit [Clostridia bacterium]
MKKTVFLIITSAVMVLAIFAVGYTKIEGIEYTSALRVMPSEGREYVVCSGTVEYAGSRSVQAEGNGAVQAVFMRNGDSVHEGDAVMTVLETSAQLNVTDLISALSSGGASSLLSSGTVRVYTAQSSGIISGLDVDAGGFYTKGQTLFSVSEQNSYQVSVNVSERDIKKIEKGQTVEITCPALEKSMRGTVSSIGSTAKQTSTQTGKSVTVKVIVAVNEPPHDLRTGYTAECSILTDIKSDILVLPYSAVRTEGGKAFVYISRDTYLEECAVTLGKEFSSGVEIMDGLSEGDIVAADIMTVKDPASTVVNEVIADGQ